jgi:hypothetical protein
MNVNILVCLSLFLLSCGESQTTTPPIAGAPDSSVATPINMQGYTPSYSGSFEMGDPKNVETVLQLYKDWDNGTPNAHIEAFADTVQMNTSDGTNVRAARDSSLASGVVYRAMFSTVTTTVHSVFPIKSTDKNEQWVCIWAKEVHTNKASGKVDSVELQEAWRFDNNGKVNRLLQYDRPAAVVASN